MSTARRCGGRFALLLVGGLAVVAPFQAGQGDQGGAREPAATDCLGDPLPSGAVARLGTVRLRQGYAATALAFTPSGHLLVAGGRFSPGVCLWDVATGKPLYRQVIPSSIYSLALSPDGKLLLTGNTLSVLDAATGKELRRLPPPTATVFDHVAFSPDGRTVAFAAGEPQGAVYLWDATTGKQLRRLTAPEGLGGPVAFAPDGKALATGGEDNTVRMWDVATGKELRQFHGPKEKVFSLAFAPRGRVLAAAGGDNRDLWLWDADTGKPRHRLAADETNAEFAFAPDGKALASTGSGGRLRLWDVATGKPIRAWDAEGASSLAFAPDGKTLATTAGPAIRLWDVATGKEIFPAPLRDTTAHRSSVYEIRWPAGNTLFTLGQDRTVLAWDPASGRARGRAVPLGPKGVYWSRVVTLSPDGKVVAQTGFTLPDYKADPVIHLWDAATGKELRALAGHKERVRGLRFGPDGNRLASVGPDGIRLWDVAAGKQLHHLPRHQGERFVALAFSPDGKQLASAGSDGILRLWDAATGKELRQHNAQLTSVHYLAFAPDGRWLAAVGDDQSIRFWVVGTDRELPGIRVPGYVFALAVSPTGRTLATAVIRDYNRENGDRVDACTIHHYEVCTGQEIRRIDVPQGLVWSLGFAPDGRALASAGSDSTVLLWDLTGAAGSPAGPAQWTAAELEALWSDLAGDAARAHRALWALARAPQQSVPFLKDRLRPAKPADAAAVGRLVADLGSKDRATRDKASRALEALGASAEAALRRSLDGPLALEQRRRVEQVLQKRRPEMLRQLRAVEALEHVGGAEARGVLGQLAKGAPNPKVAQDAAAALRRLSHRE
jgi:WD40 repeat protein